VLKFALLLFALIGFSLCAVGMIYLTVGEFMPYHSEALEADWSELGPNEKGLILGLLNGLGSGAFIAGSAVLYMVSRSMRLTPNPYIILLPLVASGYSGLLCYATFFVSMNTPGNPPLLANAILVGVAVLASCMLGIARASQPEN
jgi:hypothetical protein